MIEEDFCGNLPELFHGLSNDCERRDKHVSKFKIIKADHGNITGCLYSQFAQRAYQAAADHIIAAEECSRWMFSVEEPGNLLKYKFLR